jgi:GNAT superfamily N-acetyltransferase
MYEQPQTKVVFGGDFSNSEGKYIEILTPDDKQIGILYLTKLQNANLLDPEFETYYDEKKFQTVPLNYDNSLFGHGFEINPEFRGNGYGDQLLNHCQEFVKNSGHDYLTFIMDSDNPIAQNMYEKRGYNILNSSNSSKFYFVKV